MLNELYFKRKINKISQTKGLGKRLQKRINKKDTSVMI